MPACMPCTCWAHRMPVQCVGITDGTTDGHHICTKTDPHLRQDLPSFCTGPTHILHQDLPTSVQLTRTTVSGLCMHAPAWGRSGRQRLAGAVVGCVWYVHASTQRGGLETCACLSGCGERVGALCVGGGGGGALSGRASSTAWPKRVSGGRHWPTIEDTACMAGNASAALPADSTVSPRSGRECHGSVRGTALY